MPGPPPKPTAIRQLEGNRSRRPIPAAEPKISTDRAPMPRHLTGLARGEWRRLEPQLRAAGVLTVADRATLAAYCREYQRWVDAEAAISKTGGEVTTTDAGNLVQNPWLAVANKALVLMRGFAADLGISPASRSRVAAAVPEDPMDQLDDIIGRVP